MEGIYAATGTICPLPKLMELRQKYKLRIFIDESISFGVLGSNGKGITEYFNVNVSGGCIHYLFRFIFKLMLIFKTIFNW